MKMNIILLSGGSGKRLWPLSNEVRSKQFLKIMKNDSGYNESMLQRVYEQINTVGLGDNVIVTASRFQEESIRCQLGNKVSIVLEPERRDTFPAIALSVAYLYYIKKCSRDSVVAILPVDPYANNSYFEKIKELENIISDGIANIALLGVKPTYPSEKYGYIIPERIGEKYNFVKHFKEKPTQGIAMSYINEGALWNCGVFCFKIGYILDKLCNYIEFNSYEDIYAQYSNLKKVSFDYEVIENEKSVFVVPYEGEWRDIGTWNTLTEVMDEQNQGNVITGEGNTNTHIVNELDIPIMVLGASNLVVVASNDGILVSDKEKSSYMKRYTDAIDQRPMFEEKEWGQYKVVDISLDADNREVVTKKKTILEGEKTTDKKYGDHIKIITVLNGKCTIVIDNKGFQATSGDTFTIPENVEHSIEAITMVQLLETKIYTKVKR